MVLTFIEDIRDIKNKRGGYIIYLGDKFSGNGKVDVYEKDGIIFLEDFRNKARARASYYLKTVEWLLEMERTTNIVDDLRFHNFSLWWMIRNNTGFYYYLMKLFLDIDSILILSETLKDVKEIAYYGENLYWYEIIKGIFRDQRISMHPFLGTTHFFKILQRWFNQFIEQIFELRRRINQLIAVIDGFLKLLWFRRKNYPKKKKKILVACAQRDLFLKYIIEDLSKQAEIIVINAGSNPRKKFPHIHEKSYCLFNPLLFISAIFKKGKHRYDFEKIILVPYHNIDIKNLIREKLTSLADYYQKAGLFYYHLYRITLNIEKPDALLITHERGLRELLVGLSQERQIQTFALQHGIIDPVSHQSYIYNRKTLDEIPYFCQKTFVFSEFYKMALVKKSIYTKEMVQVVGYPRTDWLFKIPYNREETFRRLRIPLRKKIILFSTSTEKDDIAFLEKLATLNEDFFIIIKMHPYEARAYRTKYQRIFKKYKKKNFIIVQTVDFYELLNICDVHCNVFSTVIVEAALWGKPTIIMHPGAGFLQDCVKMGVAISLDRYPDIYQAIDDLLPGGKMRTLFEKHRKLFIKKYFNTVDGKVSDRVVQAILDNLKIKRRDQ